MLSRLNTYILLMLLLCLLSLKSTAQLNASYNIGCIASANNNITFSSNSIALTVDKCVQVSNGLSKFLAVNKSEFVNLCELVIPLTGHVEYTVFPNPFNEYLSVKSTEPLGLRDVIVLNIYSAFEGRLVSSTPVTNGYALKTGVRINTNNLISGNYVLDINVNHVSRLFKILKIN